MILEYLRVYIMGEREGGHLFGAPDESVQVVILEYLRHQCLSEQGVGRATTREQGGSLEGECHMTGMTSKQTAI